ncbi:rhomboid family intramembrane serine protease [Streptomyces minutiscleroticus]|uniref:Rhomboid family intramembrane serine protease n=1 Tax=Streptomyces minutiscleroticus TaxID=68238 RepID=A0A918N8M4_9ACTN|nr:rhomboid family intramembrane serine protease [Streptomyces minutiscleroticus]GGX54232.1 rhomboid family intramembrane serine protease [Streptomyces minutiscleroticus]
MEPESPSPLPPESAVAVCHRHPGAGAHVRCGRCDRYVCPDCRRGAAAGPRCPRCVRRARTAFGGRVFGAPGVTSALICLNLLVYLAELVRPEIVDRFETLGAGLAGPDGGHYVWQDAYPPGYEPEGVVAGEWYRLLTGAFLHLPPTDGTFGVLHVVLNMVLLWMVGRAVEAQLGRVRYLALYLLSALGGSVLVLLLAPDVPTVGASGAIFGLGAAYYVTARRLGGDPRGVDRFMAGLLIWLLVSAGLTSWQGHLGGLLTGGAVTAALAYAPRGPRRSAVQAAACAGALVLLVLLAAVRAAALRDGAV